MNQTAYRLNLSEDPQAMGREFARNLQVCFRLGRTHGWANEASESALSSLVSVMNALFAARGEYALHVAPISSTWTTCVFAPRECAMGSWIS